MTNYQIHEMFSSFQGEGFMAGSPATFIRLQGCPVGCSWCDAKRTWGPVNRTDDYEIGVMRVRERSLSDGQIYQPLIQEMHAASPNYEIVRGVVAELFNIDSMVMPARTPGVAFITSNTSSVAADTLVKALSMQDLHPTVADGIVRIPNNQLRIFVDFFTPDGAKERVNLTPRRSGDKMDLEQIVDYAVQARNQHVVVTGGEPLLWNLDPLFDRLRQMLPGVFIQVETSGMGGYKGQMLPDLTTWSPKQNLGWNAPEAFKRIVGEVKFVVDSALELELVARTWMWYANELGASAVPRFVMMPEGCPPKPDAVEKALEFARQAPMGQYWFVGARLQYAYGVR